MNETRPTITLPVRLGGETRDVVFQTREFPELGDGTSAQAWSSPIAAARIGRGTKYHRCSVSAYRFVDEAAARRRGYYRENIVPCDDGQVWGIQTTTTIRNRSGAQIVEWADKVEGTGRGAQHDAYNRIA